MLRGHWNQSFARRLHRHGDNCVFFVLPNSPSPTDEYSGNYGVQLGGAFVDESGQFMSFDGSGDWFGFASPQTLDITSDWTLECHAKDIAATDAGAIIGRGTTAGGAGRWALFLSGSSGNVAFYADDLTGAAIVDANSVVAADGNWRHIAVVRNGSNWYLFKDGVQVDTGTQSGTAGTTSSALNIGADAVSASSRTIAGKVSRVKITRAALWTSGFTPPARTDP